MSDFLKKIVGLAALGVVVYAGVELVRTVFEKDDKLISREGSKLLSNPEDKKKLDLAIKQARDNANKKSDFINADGEKITIVA